MKPIAQPRSAQAARSSKVPSGPVADELRRYDYHLRDVRGLAAGIRPFVIGRRNWLFADTVAGAHASASLCSLVEPSKANGVDPYAYLVSLFSKLPTDQTADDFEALLPWCLAGCRR